MAALIFLTNCAVRVWAIHRGKKKEERDSPVGAAFSRDLAL
jgi:hypothetical protein